MWWKIYILEEMSKWKFEFSANMWTIQKKRCYLSHIWTKMAVNILKGCEKAEIL
jgi:hypothetical protein